MSGDEVREGWRFIVTADGRGGSMNGMKGTILGWNPRKDGAGTSASLVRAMLDGDPDHILFYYEEIELLPIVDQLAALA